jgi:hypothetical protein
MARQREQLSQQRLARGLSPIHAVAFFWHTRVLCGGSKPAAANPSLIFSESRLCAFASVRRWAAAQACALRCGDECHWRPTVAGAQACALVIGGAADLSR